MLTLMYEPGLKAYPGSEDFFSPSTHYPEYPFSSSFISVKPNIVYDLVRELFAFSHFDEEHYGTNAWNPLGDVIKEGDCVLIKPNWVENKNKNHPGDLSCLVTNPSIVRAVLDYVVIALRGTGHIVIADAPMQGCDLNDLLLSSGYDKLFEFYRCNGVDITIYDLRKYSVDQKYKGITGDRHYNDNEGSVMVDLGRRSLHIEHDSDNVAYKVEDYLSSETNSYHNTREHIYSISTTLLNANVVINMPKPKTHRLAGITGAVKNFVGITYDKASLPHRMEGDKESGAGDAYFKRSVWKRWMGIFGEIRTIRARNGQYATAKIFDYLMKFSYVIGSKTSGDDYRIGSWYGNDTIWRTAVDLNNIALHCDIDGTMHKDQIRKIISIGDMIVAGEKEGPVGPSPKPLGVLVMSDNALLFDLLVCHIMGFSDDKLPMFNNTRALDIFGFRTKSEMLMAQVISNQSWLYGRINALNLPKEWVFAPHPCWKGYIEK